MEPIDGLGMRYVPLVYSSSIWIKLSHARFKVHLKLLVLTDVFGVQPCGFANIDPQPTKVNVHTMGIGTGPRRVFLKHADL